jgi:hypothetical protein
VVDATFMFYEEPGRPLIPAKGMKPCAQ